MYYPLDHQFVHIRLDSWMSQENRGKIEIRNLSEASSSFTEDFTTSQIYNNRYEIKEKHFEIKKYNWHGVE